jgi:hypothetical protein
VTVTFTVQHLLIGGFLALLASLFFLRRQFFHMCWLLWRSTLYVAVTLKDNQLRVSYPSDAVAQARDLLRLAAQKNWVLGVGGGGGVLPPPASDTAERMMRERRTESLRIFEQLAWLVENQGHYSEEQLRGRLNKMAPIARGALAMLTGNGAVTPGAPPIGMDVAPTPPKSDGDASGGQDEVSKAPDTVQ